MVRRRRHRLRRCPGVCHNVDGSFACACEAGFWWSPNVGECVPFECPSRGPEVISTLDQQGTTVDVQVVGNLAYLLNENGGLQIVDVTDPAAPASLGAVEVQGNAVSLFVWGSYVYISSEFSEGTLHVVDVSDPDAPRVVSNLWSKVVAHGFAVQGDRLFLTHASEYNEGTPETGFTLFEVGGGHF